MSSLEEIINYANKHCEYYRKQWYNISGTMEKYASITKTTKDNVRTHNTEIISNEYNNLLFKSLYVNATSGTSGKPVEIYWNKDDMLRSNLCLWRKRHRFYGITPSDKFCSLHTISYTANRIRNLEKIIFKEKEISFCKLKIDDDSLLLYYQKMIEFDPAWLFFHPNFLVLFINFMEKYELPLPKHIKYIELTGEPLTNQVRNKIEQTFKCPVANLYACMELNGIAYECPEHKLHLIDENVHIDIEGEGNIGNVLLTSLNNHSFPLIKYELGDMVEKCDHYMCKCGNTGTIIKRIVGRSNNKIYLKHHIVIDEAIISYCVDRAESVVGFGIVQYKAKYVDNKLIISIFMEKDNSNWLNAFSFEIKRQFKCFSSELFVDIVVENNIRNVLINKKGSKYSLLEV